MKTRSTSTQKFIEAFEQQHEELGELLTTEIAKLQVAIEPWQTEINRYLEHTPFKEFGDYLYKILGKCINAKAVEYESLSVQNGFYYKPIHGRRAKVVPERLLYALNKKFVECTRNAQKNKIVEHFLVFKEATKKALEQFYQPIVCEIKTPVKVIYTGYMTTGDNVVEESKSKSRRLYYIKGEETIVPALVTLSFTESSKPFEMALSRATSGGHVSKEYVAHIAVFGPTPKSPDYHQLIGYTSIEFGERKQQFANLLELQQKLLDKKSSGGYGNRDSVNVPRWVTDYFNSVPLYTESYGTSGQVEISGKVDLVRALLPDKGVPGINIDGHHSPIGGGILTNWADIFVQPDIQQALRQYADAYKIVAKAWSYMKQKFSYKIIEHGLF